MDDRAARQREDVVHELLVEEGQARLERVRHRRAIFVAQQRGQAVDAEVLEQAALEIIGDPVVHRRLAPAAERRCEHARDVDALTAFTQAPADQRAHDVAEQPRLTSELGIAAFTQKLAEQHVRIMVVPRQKLIAGLTVQGDRDLPSGQAHHHPHGERRRRDHRLLHVPDPRLQLADEVLVGGLHRAVVRPRHVEHAVDVRALVDAIPGEHRRERFQTVTERLGVANVIAELLRHHGADRGRVETAAQADANRDVGDETTLDRALEDRAKRFRARVAVL